MSISSSTRKAGPFACNGSTVAFPFAFKVFTTADVRVVLTDSNSVESDLALGTNYTVALNADQDANPGGTVTTTATYATGYKITLTSQVQNLQPVTLTNQGGFYPQVINNALDRLTIMAQQLAEQVGRAVKTSISSSSTPDQLLSDIGAAVTNASNSATAAAGSATAAANSATQAANSAAAVGFTLTSVSTFQNKTLQASGGNTVEATSGPGASAFSLRNKIINGDFSVWQRGASFGSIAQYQYLADRWANQSGSNTSAVVSRQATANGYCLRWTAGSTTSQFNLTQALESVSNAAYLSGKTVTFSVGARVNAGNVRTYAIAVHKNSTGDTLAGGSWTQIAASAPVTLGSGSFQTLSVTCAIPSDGTANGIRVSVYDNQTGLSADYVEVTTVQLEVGSVATPFEQRPYGFELSLCQRYLPAWNSASTNNMVGIGQVAGATDARCLIQFTVLPRVPPTGITVSSASHFSISASAGGGVASAIVFDSSSYSMGRVQVTGSSMTAGQAVQLYMNNSSGQLLFTGCEL